MSSSTSRKWRRNAAGFTLVEVVVALAIVAASVAAIGSLIATNVRGTRAVDQRLSLVERGRAILAGLPPRARLASGSTSGETAGHRWQVDVRPLAGGLVDPRLVSPWVPQTVSIRVQSATGQGLRIDTVRLLRGPGAPK